MADQMHVTRGEVEGEMTLPAGSPGVIPNDDPDAARQQIQATRARMSETIDEIEDVLLRKKEQIQGRLDILSPVRERPMQVLGGIFAAGLLLGLATGGDDEDEEEYDGRGRMSLDAWERADTWEDRAHRLLRIAREQEAELELLRSRAGHAPPARSTDEAEEYDDESDDSVLDRLRDAVMERVAAAVSDGIHRMIRG